MPVPACAFARATFCQRSTGEAAYGYDRTRRTTRYGLRLHARTTRAGAIVAFDLAPANVADQGLADQLDPPPGTVVLGARNDWSPNVKAELAAGGVTRAARFRTEARDPDPARSRRLSKARWMIEAAFGQVAGRFHLERTWARDLWHLSHRAIRKVLGHPVAVWINRTLGRHPLDFDGLVTGETRTRR